MSSLDFGIEMKDRVGEIILNNCKIHFDPDNSAQHYLERGVSREAFFRFAGQIGEIMLKCMEKKMTVDLDLKHIRMENDVPNFSIRIGESGLTDRDAALYLKDLAYKANFIGSDFLMYVYDYMTYIDTNIDKPLNIIIGKIYAMESGTFEKAEMQSGYSKTVHIESPERTAQSTRIEQPVRYEQPTGYGQPERIEQPTRYGQPAEIEQPAGYGQSQRIEQPAREERTAREEEPLRLNPEPSVTGTLTSFHPETEYENYSENGETGVLDPSFWNRYGNAADSGQEDNPHRIKRGGRKDNEPSAVLQAVSDGQRYVLDKECIVFGKDAASADYVLPNDTISRAHAEIKKRSGSYYITDLGSTNGTFINSRRLPKNTAIEVSNGDTVKFSNVELRFMTII
ncbi:MAG: FHA domain-containing protein [Lachnospiraceae bacterium]|nr:FHA domain-containing protein [Lachnospiraceae bacterium]